MPEKAKEPRHKTRVAAYPKVRAGHHLLEVLFEAGPTQMVGMGGLAPVSELELLAWQVNRDEPLTPWEVATVKRLSAAYAAQAMESRAPSCPAPYVPPREAITEDQRARIAREMANWAERLERQLSRKPPQ